MPGPLAKAALNLAKEIEKAEEAHIVEVAGFLRNQDHASKLIAERAAVIEDSRETNRRLRLDLEAAEAVRKDLLGRQERNRVRAELVRAFLAQAEKCQFSDPEGHRLEMNDAFFKMRAAFTDTPPKTAVAVPLGIAIEASNRAIKRRGGWTGIPQVDRV